jgi:glycosyltransferase involved in cell wall biosynthesis
METVSILLPTYNGACYIARAIESVLAQSYVQWSLIVIDDGSTDNTAQIVDQYIRQDHRIRYVSNDHNLGIQKTLNKGMGLAQGAYVARIDDDDRWTDTDKLKKQVDFFERHPGHVLVGTGVILVDEQDTELIRYLLPATDAAIRNKLLGKNCFVHSSVMFKREVALAIGGYDESKDVLHMEDYDLWLKLGQQGMLANIPEYCTTFTLRSGGLSSQNKIDQAKKAFFLAKKYRDAYPHYRPSVIRAAIRYVVYGFIVRFPVRIFVNRLAKWYKENW